MGAARVVAAVALVVAAAALLVAAAVWLNRALRPVADFH